jgi:hypothetical protein
VKKTLILHKNGAMKGGTGASYVSIPCIVHLPTSFLLLEEKNSGSAGEK